MHHTSVRHVARINMSIFWLGQIQIWQSRSPNKIPLKMLQTKWSITTNRRPQQKHKRIYFLTQGTVRHKSTCLTTITSQEMYTFLPKKIACLNKERKQVELDKGSVIGHKSAHTSDFFIYISFKSETPSLTFPLSCQPLLHASTRW